MIGNLNDKLSRDYPLGLYFHIDICMSQFKPQQLEGKLKNDFMSCVSRASLSHRTYYIHRDDWDAFNKASAMRPGRN